MVVVHDLFIACSLVVILWRLLFVNVVLVVVVIMTVIVCDDLCIHSPYTHIL